MNFKKGLYLIPTPIGNLQDITLRSLETLKKSEFIICEDTRTTKNLLEKYKIKSKLISNHKFNEKKNLPKLIQILKSGSIISLVSDAGTPCISDPGGILIKECIKNEIDVIPLPGPSAVSTAISLSGFSDKFFFYGFFPEKNKIILEDLKVLSKLDCSIVFFISSKKLNRIIPFIKDFFSDRDILICREMTKLYEEYIRIKIKQLEPFQKEFKGELTLVISNKNDKKRISQNLNESDKRLIRKTMSKFSIKEIIDIINNEKKISKKEIYNYYLKLKNEN